MNIKSNYIQKFQKLQQIDQSDSPFFPNLHIPLVKQQVTYKKQIKIQQNHVGTQNQWNFLNNDVLNQHNQIPDSKNKEANTKKQQLSKIQYLISLLLNNVQKSQEKLNEAKRMLIQQQDPIMQTVYDILLKKFKKLKKKKQEMIKYCMRKAFKFLFERKLQIKTPNDLLRHYFMNYENDQSFTVPFKKDSLEKTMNCNFLKKVFSSERFVNDYILFLENFSSLFEEDNSRKIKFLASSIEQILKTNQVQVRSLQCQKIKNIKRLPWTVIIFEKCHKIANMLLQYSPFNIPFNIPQPQQVQLQQKLLYIYKHDSKQNNKLNNKEKWRPQFFKRSVIILQAIKEDQNVQNDDRIKQETNI